MQTRTKILLGVAGGVCLLVGGIVVGLLVSGTGGGAAGGAAATGIGGFVVGQVVRRGTAKSGGVGAVPAVVHNQLQADLDEARAGRQAAGDQVQRLEDVLIGLRADLDKSRQDFADLQRKYNELDAKRAGLEDAIAASKQSGSDLGKLIGG